LAARLALVFAVALGCLLSPIDTGRRISGSGSGAVVGSEAIACECIASAQTISRRSG